MLISTLPACHCQCAVCSVLATVSVPTTTATCLCKARLVLVSTSLVLCLWALIWTSAFEHCIWQLWLPHPFSAAHITGAAVKIHPCEILRLWGVKNLHLPITAPNHSIGAPTQFGIVFIVWSFKSHSLCQIWQPVGIDLPGQSDKACICINSKFSYLPSGSSATTSSPSSRGTARACPSWPGERHPSRPRSEHRSLQMDRNGANQVFRPKYGFISISRKDFSLCSMKPMDYKLGFII